MARFMEPTVEQVDAYRAWVAERPAAVRAVAERFEPWSLYEMQPHGQRVTIVSFGEGDDGTVTLTVNVSAAFNFTMFERQVFGVHPDTLTPCDLPADGERLGAMLSPEQVDANLDMLRVTVRPDLWEIDDDDHAKPIAPKA